MNGLGLTVSPMDMHPSMGYPPGESRAYVNEASFYALGKTTTILNILPPFVPSPSTEYLRHMPSNI